MTKGGSLLLILRYQSYFVTSCHFAILSLLRSLRCNLPRQSCYDRRQRSLRPSLGRSYFSPTWARSHRPAGCRQVFHAQGPAWYRSMFDRDNSYRYPVLFYHLHAHLHRFSGATHVSDTKHCAGRPLLHPLRRVSEPLKASYQPPLESSIFVDSEYFGQNLSGHLWRYLGPSWEPDFQDASD